MARIQMNGWVYDPAFKSVINAGEGDLTSALEWPANHRSGRAGRQILQTIEHAFRPD